MPVNNEDFFHTNPFNFESLFQEVMYLMGSCVRNVLLSSSS